MTAYPTKKPSKPKTKKPPKPVKKLKKKGRTLESLSREEG